MDTRSRTGCVKFFRRLIATSQPQEIEKIVNRYNKQLEETESNYMDLLLYSGINLNYQDIMSMPVDSLRMLVEKINHYENSKTGKQFL